MTLVTGTVQDLGYDGMEGTLWARPARFRSDGQVVLAPERKPYRVVDGVVSADLAPGPAVLELQVGSHARGTFEVVIPEADTTLADLLDTVFAWEPAQVSLFVAEREAAEQAASEAEAAAGQAVTAAGTATSAAQQAGQDRSHVDQVRTELDEAFDESTAGNVLPPRLTETALNATYGTKTEVSAVADSVQAVVNHQPIDVLSYGTNDAAIHAASTAALSGGRELLFRKADYTMGQVSLPGASGMTIRGEGNPAITLQGAGAGFRVGGTVDGFHISDLTIIGDGTIASDHRAVGSGGAPSAFRNFTIEKLTCRDVRIGISLSAEGATSGTLHNIKIRDNDLSNIVGGEAGQGYGIHVASDQTDDMALQVVGNLIDKAGRHSIYIARGYGYAVESNTITDHRHSHAGGAGLSLSAINTVRGGRGRVAQNRIVGAAGGAVWAAGDEDFQIEANTILDPTDSVPAVWVGGASATGPTDFQARQVDVVGNYFRFGPGSVTGGCVRVGTGQDVNIMDNRYSIDASLASGYVVVVNAYGSALERLRILRNAGTSGTRAVRFNSSGTSTPFRAVISHNDHVSPSPFFYQTAALDGPIIYTAGQRTDGIVWVTGQGFQAGNP